MPRKTQVRFKACYTCRIRKVKCGKSFCPRPPITSKRHLTLQSDEKRPSCDRCHKSGFQCEGYLPSLDFVDESQSFGENNRTPVIARGKAHRRQEQINRPSRTPNLSAFEEEISIAFLLDNWVTIPGASDIESAPKHWPGFFAIQSQESLSYECLCAFSKIFFARKNNAQSTMIHGVKAYGSALKKLNTLLASAQAGTSDDALISSMILSAYETVTASSATGWVVHSLGFGRLVETRGPLAYRCDRSRYLLEYNRFMIVLAALAVGRSTFLASPEWKLLPWLGNENEIDSMHELIDIYVDLPGLKQDALALHRHSELHRRIAFFTRAFSILSQLEKWRSAWDLHPDSKYTVVESTFTSYEGDTDPFPTSFRFAKFRPAHILSLYNAALLQTIDLITMVHRAIDPLSDTTTLSQPFNFEQLASTSEAAAREICRCLEFQAMYHFGTIGQILALFPMRMAWKAFGGGGSSIECRWLECLLSRLSGSGGLQIASPEATFGDYSKSPVLLGG